MRDLNEGDAMIDEILVLRVENGRDHFLPIRAHWQPSALARSIDKLIKIPEGGIRKLQNQIPARGEVKWSVPREIFRLTLGRRARRNLRRARLRYAICRCVLSRDPQ